VTNLPTPIVPALCAALVLAALRGQDRADPQAAVWQPHRALKVLYAGKQGGSREQAFATFLKQHFDASATIDLAQLSMATAKDYDVVIADWVSQYGNDGYEKRENSLFSAPAKLGPEFTKPVIAMSYVGTQIRARYKLDWL
jgi:hypothetical protein